ncbi:MAG: lipopolysaccharide biosynthesis protein [Cyclobacteriaceae bacterium]
MNPLKKLAGQTVIYGVSTIIGRLLNYLLVPLYTAVFKEGEYGIVTDFYAYVAFFNVLYLFGLETTYFRFANKEKNDEQNVFNTVQTLVLLNAFVITGLLVIFAPAIAEAFGYSGQEHYIYILACVMMIDAIVAIPFAKLRLEGKAKRFALTRLSNIVIVILLNLFFIVLLPQLADNNYDGVLLSFYDPEIGVGYVFISNLIANALYLLMMGDLLLRLKPSFSKEQVGKFLVYATPIMFLGLAGVTNEMLSRAILKYRLPEGFYEGLTNLGALGVFGACYKLSVFMVLAIQAFKYAAEPFFFKGASQKDSPILFSRVMNGYIIFASILMMGVIVNLGWIGELFLRSDVYLRALPVVPWLLLGGLFLGVYYNLSVWFKLTDKTIFGAYISGVGAVLTIVLNWLFIPYFGFMASAVITAMVYFVMCSISFLAGQRYYSVPYRVLKGILYIISVFGISLFLYYNPLADGVFRYGINNFIILLTIAVILKIEKIDIVSFVRKKG